MPLKHRTVLARIARALDAIEHRPDPLADAERAEAWRADALAWRKRFEAHNASRCADGATCGGCLRCAPCTDPLCDECRPAARPVSLDDDAIRDALALHVRCDALMHRHFGAAPYHGPGVAALVAEVRRRGLPLGRIEAGTRELEAAIAAQAARVAAWARGTEPAARASEDDHA